MNDISTIFAPPRYVEAIETFPTFDDGHECEPGHCSNNPFMKPVKGCKRCADYSHGIGGKPSCGHHNYVIVPVAS